MNSTPEQYWLIRRSTGLSQIAFARTFGITVASVRNYEQGKRIPPFSCRVLYGMIESHPELVAQAVRKMTTPSVRTKLIDIA